MYCPLSQRNVFKHFENYKKFQKFKLAFIAETARDRAKRTQFGEDHGLTERSSKVKFI